MNVDNWDDLRFLLALAREGTLTGASRALRVDQTTVSRRIRVLQERSGKVLFEQLRGGVRLSEAGKTLLAAAEAIEGTLHDVERLSMGQELDLVGPLRLALAELLAMAWMPELMAFVQAHPHVRFELKIADALHSLTRREADVALRVVSSPGEHLVGRRLGRVALAVYGAPRWEGADVTQAPWVGWEHATFEESTIERTRAQLGAQGGYALWADSYMILLEALRLGVGVCVLPCVLGDVIDGIVRVSPPRVMEQHMWVLTHPDLRMSPRVRALMDHLAEVVTASRARMLGEPE